MNYAENILSAVCAVGKAYQILIKTDIEALVYVEIAGKKYHSHSNGIKISSAGMHKISVPQRELDEACGYTLSITPVIDRAPYYPKLGEETRRDVLFKPLKKSEGINICHLSDVHGLKEPALAVARKEQIDLLILNGDISSTSNTYEAMFLCYELASELTRGEIPCIISRGNHDLRGYEAENLAKIMPTDQGRSYYTFRVGCVWGILVDAGEDKPDGSCEYNGVICCEDFRREEDAAIRRVIENARDEYAKEDVKYKLVVSHIPFPFKRENPFDIERELYASWGKLLRENVKPELMLCGHTHNYGVNPVGAYLDDLGQPCTVVVGSDVKTSGDDTVYSSAFITLENDTASIRLYNANGMVSKEEINIR